MIHHCLGHPRAESLPPKGVCEPVSLCDMTATVPRPSAQEAEAGRVMLVWGRGNGGRSENQQSRQEFALRVAYLNLLARERVMSMQDSHTIRSPPMPPTCLRQDCCEKSKAEARLSTQVLDSSKGCRHPPCGTQGLKGSL